jgi:5'-phosphate synthase pdxT subunit
VRVGVLALQGAFREHIYLLEAAGAEAVAVRLPEQLDDCAGLVIPGGESTTIGKLMAKYGFYDAIPAAHARGMALWGTCAGAILLADGIIDAIEGQMPLGMIDVQVRRNAYGRQFDSFETDLDFMGLDDPFTGVFIRAPWFETVGPEVEVLAELDGRVVAVRQDDVMAITFHPELTGDPRIHRYFIDEVCPAD